MLRLLALTAFVGIAHAQPNGFRDGEVLPEFGPVVDLSTTYDAVPGSAFQVAFDVADSVEEGENRHISKVARFLNMHGEGGLDPRPLDIVVVIHGKAVGDIVDEDRNHQQALVEALLGEGVRFVVCGQSMAALGVPAEKLLPGVEVALSAMTAHADLGSRGYTIMPF